MDLIMRVRLSRGWEWGGYLSLPAAKVDKKQFINPPQQQGMKKLVAGGGGNG
jgi:hypothetical protein